jgi:septal ring factor EnvC (AmiA/AmiB activator)
LRPGGGSWDDNPRRNAQTCRSPHGRHLLLRSGDVSANRPIGALRASALALIVAALLAGAPATACPETHVVQGAPTPPRAGPAAAELEFAWPVSGRIVDECWIEDKERLTIAARRGAEVGASQSGLAFFAGEFERCGNLALIRHQGGLVSATYGDIGGLRVRRGDSVRIGQPIAAMRAPEGVMAELRFELRRDDKSIDRTR